MEGHGRRRRRCSDDGAAAVEFALVVPLLVLILFGIISYGMMLSLRQTLSQAAAEGARAAAVTFVMDEKKPEAIIAVSGALESFDVSCTESGNLLRDGDDVGSCAISDPGECTPEAGDGIECVTVTLSYEYEENSIVPTFPGLGIVLPETLTYEAQARVS
jgi:hypothetical protein